MSTKNVISKNGVWKTAPLNDTPSSSGVLVVTEDYDTWTLDKTWAEIYNGMASGIVVITNNTTHKRTIVTECYVAKSDYIVVGGYDRDWSPSWTAETENGYPVGHNT